MSDPTLWPPVSRKGPSHFATDTPEGPCLNSFQFNSLLQWTKLGVSAKWRT